MGRILVPFYTTKKNLSSETYYKILRLYQRIMNTTEVLSPDQLLQWFREHYRYYNIDYFIDYWFPTNSLGLLGSAPCLEELFEEFKCPSETDSEELCEKCYKETIYIEC